MSFRPHAASNSASLLRKDRTLRQLTQAAVRLSQMQAALEQHLQPAARPWCRVAALESGVLTLIVSNAQWATHLRYQQNRLLRQLQNSGEFGNLAKIQLKMQPTIGEHKATKGAITLSEQAAKTLQETASQITSPRLRQALQRLSQHTVRGQGTQ